MPRRNHRGNLGKQGYGKIKEGFSDKELKRLRELYVTKKKYDYKNEDLKKKKNV